MAGMGSGQLSSRCEEPVFAGAPVCHTAGAPGLVTGAASVEKERYGIRIWNVVER
jgi:hypothetical protein